VAAEFQNSASGRGGERRVPGAEFREGVGPGVFVGAPAQAEVGFVQHRKDRFVFEGEFLHPAAVFVLGMEGGVEQEQDGIGAGDETAGGAVEHGAEGVGGLADAGGVEEDDLQGVLVENAADGPPRGLGDGRDDGHGFAEQGVEQGGLAGVGAADDGGDAGAEGGGWFRSWGEGGSGQVHDLAVDGQVDIQMEFVAQEGAEESRWSCSPCTRKTWRGRAPRT
jgi:hypothetical protein